MKRRGNRDWFHEICHGRQVSPMAGLDALAFPYQALWTFDRAIPKHSIWRLKWMRMELSFG